MKLSDFKLWHWVLFAILGLLILIVIRDLINLFFWLMPIAGIGFLIYYFFISDQSLTMMV